MARTTHRSNSRKIKKSVTLSPESVKLLTALRKERRALSISSVLEGILQEIHSERQRTAIERNIGDYYDSLTPEEVQERKEWAEFATQEYLEALRTSGEQNSAAGEIWFTRLHVDPPEKGPRPAVIVSVDARNRNGQTPYSSSR